MTYTSGDLETASLHVTAAEVRIEGQRRLIARFKRLGYGTTEELELLTDFVQTRDLMIAHRGAIARQLAVR